MPAKQEAFYGEWKSPITSDLIVGATIRLWQFFLDGGDLFWVETRPKEGGRNVIVHGAPDGKTADVTPSGFSARTTVHEYCGGALLVADGVVYFSNMKDQRIYRQRRSGKKWTAPEAATPENELRYADFILDAPRQRLIAVCEDH